MPAKRPDSETNYDAFGTGSKLRKQNQDVRVGYIDPVRGYIDGLTVYQSNKYAEANPGTQFIHKNRDRVVYININTVNKLTNKNIRPRKGSYKLTDDEGNYTDCNTIKGLTTNPNGTELPNKPGEGFDGFIPGVSGGTGTGGGAGFGRVTAADVANSNDAAILGGGTQSGTGTGTGGGTGTAGGTGTGTAAGTGEIGSGGSVVDTEKKEKVQVIVEGGGGVGCVAKPIFGNDGALIHIRVVHGGFGYRFPPKVKIFDPNQRGAGATAYSILGRKVVESVQPFDQESDVEDYDFNLPPLGFDPSVVPFGQSYSLSSNTVIGDWDPRKVLSVTQISGFAQELRDYLDFLKGFDPNKPWWTTRNEEPVKVVGEGRERLQREQEIFFSLLSILHGVVKKISQKT